MAEKASFIHYSDDAALVLEGIAMSMLELLLALSTALFVFFALKTVHNGR